MNLLVDMNLSPSWVGFFEAKGFTAVHWSSVGDPRAADHVLMTWARDHAHVLFTHDLDFGVIVALSGEAGPSVVQVRTLDVLPAAIGETVLAALRAHEFELTEGAILTIDDHSARVRILPVSRT